MSVLPVFAVLCIYCMQQVTLQTPQISIKVDVEKVIQDIDEDVFMGVTLDCYLMQDNWEEFDFRNGRMLNLAKGIGPSFLRFVGTACDSLTFDPNRLGTKLVSKLVRPPFTTNITMTAEDWDYFNMFVKKVGWKMIFGINAKKQDKADRDPLNALVLLKYTADKGYPIYGFELGNDICVNCVKHVDTEPDDYPKSWALTVLQRALQSLTFGKSLIISPDTTGVRQYVDDTVVDVSLMTDAVIQEINQTVFVGVALDVSLLQNNWEGLNFSNDKVLTLASGLSPCYLRFGGYAGDALTFNSSLSMVRSHMTEGGHLDPPVNFTMTGNDWDILNEFSVRAGMNLIFGLNALKRDGLKWDPTNALELLRYTQQKGYKLAGIELGNEPDEFLGRYEVYVDPDQMGTDALTFQRLLRNMSYYNNTLFIGPDTAKPFIYLDEYLDTDGGMAVDAVSFHQYYFSPEVADLVMFTEPYYFDQCIKKVIDAVDMATFHVKTKPVWLGETSTVKGAGSPGLSNTYVAALMWLDKLGVAAKFGIKTVIRQDLYGSYNSLIQPNTFDPNPDYWVTLLYKRLVGSRVFNLTTSSDNSVRVYAHCAKQTSYYDYGSGSVVLYAVNLNRNNVTLSLLQFGDRHLDVFWLTSQGNNITATVVQLNGSPLHLINNAFPALNPLKLTSYLTIPALSLGFVVIPDAKVKLCI